METKVGPIIVAVLYLVLVAVIILFCANRTSTFDEYSQYWGIFGTLVGVATGAIPSFFFKTQADRATARAEKESSKAQIYAGAADPDKVQAAIAGNPAFQ